MVFDKPYQTPEMGLDHFFERLYKIYKYACEQGLTLSYSGPVETR